MWKGKSIVKKSNYLVNARYDFTILEIRLFNLMVSQITNYDKDFKTYKISIQDFIKMFNIKNKNIYKELEKTTDRLIEKIVKIPIEEWGKKKLFKTSLVSSFKYNIDGSWVIEATFHPDLKPHLLQIKNRFLMYDIKHILNISSSNSVHVYELLKAFEGIGKRTFELEELKEMLWVAEKYSWRYYNFKKRIIGQAQKDLKENTDIIFSLKESRFPWTKKIDKITFFISPNKAPSKENSPIATSSQQSLFPLNAESDNHLPKWISILKKYKFSQNIIESQISSKYEVGFIEATLKYCEQYFKQANIPNKEGFILKALEKGYYNDLILEEEQKGKNKIQEWIIKKNEDKLQNSFQEYLNQEVENAIMLLLPQRLEELKKDFLTNMEDNTFFKTALSSYGFEHGIIQGQWKIFLRDKLLTEKQRSINAFQKNQSINKQNN